MSVGNDVVDLAEPDNRASQVQVRFVERVCAPSEREALSASPDPAVRLWSLFAVKEAAYKALQRLGLDPGFGHRRIVVADDLRTVRFAGMRLHAWVDVHRERGFVHALASASPERPRTAIAEVGTGTDPGQAARLLLCQMVAPALGCPPGDLVVVRPSRPDAWDGLGPPVLHRRGRAVAATDVSLSHDGRFIACAAVVHGHRAHRHPVLSAR